MRDDSEFLRRRSDTARLCRDCRHIGPPSGVTQTRKCLNPASTVISVSYFDGSPRSGQLSIEVERILGRCGQDGVLWGPAACDHS